MNTLQGNDFSKKLMTESLAAMTGLAMVFSLYMIFVYVPTERVMGVVQRIFYVHVPLAWVSFLAFFIVFAASIAYLSKRDRRWDALAASSAEIGIVFCSLVLITGPIWAKKAWNTWWTWDPRLTTTLVLWFIYVAYLMLRSFSADEDRGSRIAAVFGIVGFIDVPIVYTAIHWGRTIHPALFTAQESGLAPPMMATLMVSVLTFTLLYCCLLIQRFSLFRLREEVDRLKEQYSCAMIGT
jgi:heme exporter protein C